eukprot:CAMPEP_0206235002 /NCGR_PEP_ID=MMETSP0047_2-20121206/12907_1 /ASSEMBLY_ACC=CAM_ASM_000192 /TAXON_ID=195065 /ORGANISM="Chroomonas mesostigmatica_cf, Strain CCMP1168" /LENGTH=675 /DNA_ID=CAMNT_0053659157 /DNA_START=32 /DNA_END=2059 /DNA_ORIENTATION=+
MSNVPAGSGPGGSPSALEQYLLENLAELQARLASAEVQTGVNADAIRQDRRDINAGWLVVCGALGFFMQTGFAMLETGVVAKNNVINILYKNITDACVAATFFWLIGYGLAYGDTAGGVIGTNGFGLDKIYNNAKGFQLGSDGWEIWFFQWAFVGTAATIVSGSVCERIKIEAYFAISVAISAFIYPVVVHWVWGKGFMAAHRPRPDESGTPRWFYNFDSTSNGFLDFAGSGVVHMVGGFTGLVGAIFLGPRIGRFNDVTGEVMDMPEHNIAFMALGVGILWFGWYGFNCGSTLALAGFGNLVAKVALNTTIAGAAGCVMGVLNSRFFEKTFNVGVALNGILAGLVSITGSCAVVNPWMACIIGSAGSTIFYGARRLLFKLKIDDPLDAAPIHGFAGIWGVLASGIFCTDANVQYAKYPNVNNACGSGQQFAVQVIGMLIILAWTVVTSAFFFTLIKYTIGLRVPAHFEEMGMDVVQHNAGAYGNREATPGWQLEAGGGAALPYDDEEVTGVYDPYKPKSAQLDVRKERHALGDFSEHGAYSEEAQRANRAARGSLQPQMPPPRPGQQLQFQAEQSNVMSSYTQLEAPAIYNINNNGARYPTIAPPANAPQGMSYVINPPPRNGQNSAELAFRLPPDGRTEMSQRAAPFPGHVPGVQYNTNHAPFLTTQDIAQSH